MKDDFYYENAEVLAQECEKCGRLFEICDGEYKEECPRCGGNLLNETNFEGIECHICNKEFEVWEDAYIHDKDSNIIICSHCYEDLD